MPSFWVDTFRALVNGDVKRGIHLCNMSTETNLSHLDEMWHLREETSSKLYHRIGYMIHVWNLMMWHCLNER